MKILVPVIAIAAATAACGAVAQQQPSLAAIRTACAADAQKYCADVPSGAGRIVMCLKEHKDALSDQCRQAAGALPAASAAGEAAPPASVTAAGSLTATPPHPSGTARPAKRASAKGGDVFVEHIITDPDHQGMRVASIHLPQKWTFASKLEWHYGWVEYPVSYSAHAENPDNAEAYFQYPSLRFESIVVPAQLQQYDRGPKYGPGMRMPLGAISLAPQPPMQALTGFIRKARPNVANLKWLGQQELPRLAQVLKVPAQSNQHGIAIKIGYDLNGQAVEEAFFGVYFLWQGANTGVNAGMIKQTNWGIQALQSFRAPAGTLDQRMPMFCVIATSVYINPQWGRLSKAIQDKMVADFNQKLQQGYDQLRAAQAIVEQTMKQQAAFQAQFDKQEIAFRSSGGGSAGGGEVDDSYLRDNGARSAADHWSDLIRGVDTLEDPSTGGTTQLSNLGEYHFTDGFGNYRTYDNPNDTPENNNENGTWTRMQEAP